MNNFYSVKKETSRICHQLVPQTKFVERSMKRQALDYPRFMRIAIQNGYNNACGSLHENTKTQLPSA